MNRGAVAIAALAAAAFMTGALAQDAPETTKRCESARKKIEREQKSVDAAADSIARDRHARVAQPVYALRRVDHGDRAEERAARGAAEPLPGRGAEGLRPGLISAA